MRLASYVFAILLLAPSLGAAANPNFSGTWQATVNNQPAITLSILEDQGAIRGEVAFYEQTNNGDGTWRVAGKLTVPLLSPKVKGNALTFHAQYYKSRHNADLGIAEYRLVPDGPNTSVLSGIGHRHMKTPLRLIRQQ